MPNNKERRTAWEWFGRHLLLDAPFDLTHIPRTFAIYRHLLGLLPEDPRCRSCQAPFSGIGAPIVRILLRKRPSNYTPLLCNRCEQGIRENPGGTEIELSMLFADIRGSTSLAEHMSPSAYSELINRFYTTATKIFVRTDAFIDKLSGDEVLAVYIPGFAGLDHAARAIEAARELLTVTGHADPQGPWIKVGAGVHTGVAWFGSLGSREGVTDITVLGDSVNTTARLASAAKAGEVIVSEQSMQNSHLETSRYIRRSLRLKGKSEEISAFVLHVKPLEDDADISS